MKLAADSVARVCTVINSPVGSIFVAMLEVCIRVENDLDLSFLLL